MMCRHVEWVPVRRARTKRFASNAKLWIASVSKVTPVAKNVAMLLGALSERKQAGMTFTELAAKTQISRATCHSILNGLIDVGYVDRLENKTFIVGKAFESVLRTAVGTNIE
jgi:hypothetical protein